MHDTIETPVDDDLEVHHFPAEPTPEEIDWAQQNLANIPVTLCYKRTVARTELQDGQLWRYAGALTVIPGERFKIHVFAGATLDDLRRLNGWVQAARDGRFSRWGWEDHRSVVGAFEWSCWWAIDQEPHTTWSIQPCTEPACVAFGKHHVGQPEDVLHELPETRPGVGVSKVGSGRWGVWIHDLDAELDDESGASLINDIQWALADARSLNRERDGSA